MPAGPAIVMVCLDIAARPSAIHIRTLRAFAYAIYTASTARTGMPTEAAIGRVCLYIHTYAAAGHFW